MPISIDILQRITDNDASLIHLDLSQQELSCSDINLLYQFLESNTFMKSLNVSCNLIGPRGAIMLAKNKNLKNLNILFALLPKEIIVSE
jgi:hypothetical protein